MVVVSLFRVVVVDVDGSVDLPAGASPDMERTDESEEADTADYNMSKHRDNFLNEHTIQNIEEPLSNFLEMDPPYTFRMRRAATQVTNTSEWPDVTLRTRDSSTRLDA